MAKGKGGQRVLRLKGVRRPVMTPPVEGPYPTFWRMEQIPSQDLIPNPKRSEAAWDNLSWMVSPEGDVFLTRTITGGNPEHSAGGDVISRRLGYPTRAGGDQWGGLGRSMEKGWSTVRWWVYPNETQGWLHIREAGKKTTATLRRVQNIVEKLNGVGLRMAGSRKPINIDFDMASGDPERVPWTGTYADLMSAGSWRDLGG